MSNYIHLINTNAWRYDLSKRLNKELEMKKTYKFFLF